ncbi:MAG: Hsp20/alpha crystallin family protein [Chloroflexi bacterium]|nr:Hsp20/alpha crystallin family protein [Chloroflexota bacterium]
MSTIIRKSGTTSSPDPDRHNVLHAVGWQVQVRSNIWSPPTDMYETADAYVVRVEVAGMREEDFVVSIEGNFLVISGVRPDVTERRAYHQMEIRCGKFTSAVGLPAPVDIEQASAEYVDGFLTVTLPKAKPSQIPIQE